MVPGWVRNAVFYQIFPDRFCNGDPRNDPPGVRPWGEQPTRSSFFGGDLQGIIQKLDYLEDLGITALYLTPIFTAPSNHKYDTIDYFEVDPTFGGNAALRELVDAVHSRGMRIILDGVFNHCSDQHPFFRDAMENGKGSQYWDWFTIDGDRVIQTPGPNYACWAGVPVMPEWNHKNPAVREYLLSVVRHWIREYKIDGWRLDTVEYLPPDFVRDVRRVAKEENPDAYVLGEVMGIATAWFKHDALDGVMHYKLWEALIRFIAEERSDAREFAGFVRSLWHSYPEENDYACYTLLGSHDKPRFLTLAGEDTRKLVLAAAFLFSFPGAPAVYYGDEIGLKGGEDPDCRRCFPWDESAWDKELHAVFKQLIAIRRANPVLRHGYPRFHQVRGRFLVLSLSYDTDEICLALNAGDTEESAQFGEARLVDLITGEMGTEFFVPPMGFRVFKRLETRSRGPHMNAIN